MVGIPILELKRLPSVVDNHLAGFHGRCHLRLNFKLTDIVIDAHQVAIADSALLGISPAHIDHRPPSLQLQEFVMVTPRRMDRPTGVPAGHL